MASESPVQRLFDDLLNLEVNLILKEDMTARKMPLTGEAVADIATSYYPWLRRHRAAGDLEPLEEQGRPPGQWFGLVCAQTASVLGDRAPADGPVTAENVVIKRIERNSGQLARILTAAGFERTRSATDGSWVPLPPIPKPDLLILRKAWEVSTETVIMQTVAQVDGDLLTRLQPEYAGDGHAAAHAAHARFVSTGLEHWRFMFQTLATLASGAFARLLGR